MKLILIIAIVLILSVVLYYLIGTWIFNIKIKKLNKDIKVKEKIIFEDLKKEHGQEKAEIIFEQFKRKNITNNN